MPISIGGMASGMDTDAIIDKLVNVESRPIRQLEIRKKNHNDRKEGLKTLGKHLDDVNAAARDLYGFRSAFDDKSAVSSDGTVLEAKATRGADQATRSIRVIQIAMSHRVATDPVKEDEALPAGVFTIEVDGAKEKISFGGGRLKNLQEKIDASASSLVSTTYMRTSGDLYILTMESKRSGEKGEIGITGDRDLLARIGLIGTGANGRASDVAVSFNEDHFSSYRGERQPGPENGRISVSGGGRRATVSGPLWREYEMPLPVAVKEGTTLEFDHSLAERAAGDENVPTRLRVGPKEKINIKGVILEGYNVERNRKADGRDAAVTDDLAGIGVVSTTGGKRVEKIYPLAKGARGFQKIALGKDFRDRSVDRIILYCNRGAAEFSAVRFSTPVERKDFELKNVIARPQDARLNVDGVEITRDRNDDLSDVIKGVTLTLKKASPHEISLSVTGNIDASLERVKKFVDAYNRYLEIQRNLTKAAISAKPGEFERVSSESGLFVGDMTLMRLENLMRTTVNSAYPNRAEKPIRMLPEIGVSTGAVNADWDSIKSGKLSIDEAVLKKAIMENPEGVTQFFGSDTDGDNRPDDGLAVRVVSVLRPYVAQGKNILAAKTDLEDSSIKLADESIKRQEEHVKKYSEKLRSKFSRMERAMTETNSQRQWMRYQFEGLSGIDNDKKNK